MSTDHTTDYAVYESAEDCKCPTPGDDSTQAEHDAYDENHPTGEGLGDIVDICMVSPMGTFCQECSNNDGDWTGHIVRCDECGYDADDCDCPKTEDVTP